MTMIAHSTRRRLLTGALATAFGGSVETLEGWTSTFLTFGDEVTDFGARARHAVLPAAGHHR